MNPADPRFAVLLLIMGGLSLFAIFYFCGLAILGMREARRQGVRWSEQEALIDAPVDPNPDYRGYTFFVMAPCLNEERVVGGTIAAFLEQQAVGTLIVIDDGSEDRTPQIIDEFAESGRVIRHSRTLPNAQRGKGRALNGGLALIRAEVERRGLSPTKVIVG
ncbi:MAG: glycosyltransferase, partial [Marmoricola sp.]